MTLALRRRPLPLGGRSNATSDRKSHMSERRSRAGGRDGRRPDRVRRHQSRRVRPRPGDGLVECLPGSVSQWRIGRAGQRPRIGPRGSEHVLRGQGARRIVQDIERRRYLVPSRWAPPHTRLGCGGRSGRADRLRDLLLRRSPEQSGRHPGLEERGLHLDASGHHTAGRLRRGPGRATVRVRDRPATGHERSPCRHQLRDCPSTTDGGNTSGPVRSHPNQRGRPQQRMGPRRPARGPSTPAEPTGCSPPRTASRRRGPRQCRT